MAHKHKWSEWIDDTKPLNIKSQKRLVLLSFRHCLIEGCEVIQPRIGSLTPKERTAKR